MIRQAILAAVSVVVVLSAATGLAQSADKKTIIAVDLIDADRMKIAPIAAITPDEQPAERRRQPQPADVIPMIAVLGFVAVAFAFLLYSQRPHVAARVRSR